MAKKTIFSLKSLCHGFIKRKKNLLFLKLQKNKTSERLDVTCEIVQNLLKWKLHLLVDLYFVFGRGRGKEERKEKEKNRIEERGGMNNSGVSASCVNFLSLASHSGVIEMQVKFPRTFVAACSDR